MFSSFEFPIGSKSDVKELEYISFLHQTCLPELRKDATISSMDIALYLRSRYGLILIEEEAIDIVRGLGGTSTSSSDRSLSVLFKLQVNGISIDEESNRHDEDQDDLAHDSLHDDDDHSQAYSQARDSLRGENNEKVKRLEYLDIVQVMAALLIPTLREESTKYDVQYYQASSEDESNSSSDSENIDIEDASRNDVHFEEEESDPQSSIIKLVLNIIIRKLQSQHDHGWSTTSSVSLTNGESMTEFVKDILNLFGEVDAANNSQLLNDMVSCAFNFADERGVNNISSFDEQAFARALTADISLWPVKLEDNLSTPFYDIYGFEPVDINRETNDEGVTSQVQDSKSDDAENGSSIDETTKVKIKSTAPSIDYIVDSFYSLIFVMALWTFYIYSVGVYIAMISLTAFNIIPCEESFGCQLLNRIWSWASFAFVLTVGGLIIIGPISIANDPYRVKWNWALLSGTTLVVYSLLPLILYEQETNIPKSLSLDLAIKVYLCFGGLLILLIIPMNVVSSFMSADTNTSQGNGGESFYQWLFLSRNLTSSAAIKRAANRRIKQIIDNAVRLHSHESQQPMELFLREKEMNEKRGGFLWTWRHILLSNKLNSVHGIWLHSRLAIGQEGQIIVLILFVWFVVNQTEETARNADMEFLAVQTQPESFSRDLLLSYLPSGWIIRVSMYTGCGFAITAGIILIVLYVPSTVNTILKLRCGLIPSLHDEHAKKYRLSTDTVYLNVSNMIYGLLGAMSLFFFFFGGIVYLFLWNPTRRIMMSILSWGLGLVITMTIKTVTVKICRKVHYASFYRKRPKAANLFSLAMESWTLGVAGGALIGRLTQFLLASAFWIGRIDAKYLDDDVNLFGYRFDSVPTHYRKEILGK